MNELENKCFQMRKTFHEPERGESKEIWGRWGDPKVVAKVCLESLQTASIEE